MYNINDSSVHGLGIIATQNIPIGSEIGIWICDYPEGGVRYLYQEGMEKKWYETPDLGRYCNHQNNPNTYYEFDSSTAKIISNGIVEGDEIFLNYHWAETLIGFVVDTTGFIELS